MLVGVWGGYVWIGNPVGMTHRNRRGGWKGQRMRSSGECGSVGGRVGRLMRTGEIRRRRMGSGHMC